MPPRKSDLARQFLSLPQFRFAIAEAARILRISRAQLYNRIHEGLLHPQKDGARTYITRAELERYVESCDVPRREALPEEPSTIPRRDTINGRRRASPLR
jgi:excisionase family DNA binding protein